ncbi:pyridoxamine 5'-phosphate oxidase [Aquimarina sp. ERC-38]|uniref:pyridoxamine 5'-phosphate oxidase n=1 Tax=Aquimarina sp. ERC-38 TaxID=2949996 RepID=UPI0022486DB4|nr:pyridoxamine 5'-phosphate oxidase [Aquimarina sp. ERC-38]UZO80260.1 pyridoxamine 5'-phosphate oxidase [Aquimarina sp. ERC-38]
MAKDLADYRKSYDKNELVETQLPNNPFELFEQWFNEVEAEGGVEEANAMTVASIGADGYPKARIVLLKHFDQDGFVFYTNYTSEKGKAILQNNKVCLSFFWPNLERQVIIRGEAAKVSEEQSTTYFHSRPRGSQLGAWASDQSSVIPSREVLEKELKALEDKYKEQPIPKPDFWGGIRIAPVTFEFWQGRPNRLHDRILFVPEKDQEKLHWKTKRLAP